MQLHQIWFLLAGFLLGFTVSTLWEWFHYRRERLKWQNRRIAELEAKLRDRERLGEEMRGFSLDTAPWPAPEYQSPGVFLDTEDADLADESGDAEPEAPTLIPRPVAQPVAAVTSTPKVPLADLDSEASQTVADAPETATTLVAPNPVAQFASLAGTSNHETAPTVAPAPLANTQRVRTSSPVAGLPPASPASSTPAVPSALPRRTDNHPDDLTKIKGIGDVYKLRLYAAGIYTWSQIANSDPQTLRAATRAYPSSNVEEWPEQARRLAEKQGRMGAVYTGPPPDDLSKILGIGPVGTQTLYKAGICTYEQLAATPISELTALFPIAVAGDQPDFEGWIRQAKHLAEARRKS